MRGCISTGNEGVSQKLYQDRITETVSEIAS